jgi:acylphosphatase
MPGVEIVSRAYKVRGLVQGVGFRWWAEREGRRLGLRGTVRNCHDGSVEVAFAGQKEAVDKMYEHLQTGPSAAEVMDLEELPPPEQLPDDFRITF